MCPNDLERRVEILDRPDRPTPRAGPGNTVEYVDLNADPVVRFVETLIGHLGRPIMSWVNDYASMRIERGIRNDQDWAVTQSMYGTDPGTVQQAENRAREVRQRYAALRRAERRVRGTAQFLPRAYREELLEATLAEPDRAEDLLPTRREKQHL